MQHLTGPEIPASPRVTLAERHLGPVTTVTGPFNARQKRPTVGNPLLRGHDFGNGKLTRPDLDGDLVALPLDHSKALAREQRSTEITDV